MSRNHSTARVRGSAGLCGRKSTQGMSLIEVLVSVLVLSLGLLGIAALQSMALRGGQSSLESSQAVMQASSIVEAMRANSLDATSYNTAKICSAGSVSGTSLAKNDLRAWLDSMKGTLGTVGDTTTCGKIENCPAACKVTVYWDDSRGGSDMGGSNRSMALEARI